MFRLLPRRLGRSGRAFSLRPTRRPSARPALEALEDRTLLSAMPQFNLANPASGGTFGSQVVVLSIGNIVVTDPTRCTRTPSSAAVTRRRSTTRMSITYSASADCSDKSAER